MAMFQILKMDDFDGRLVPPRLIDLSFFPNRKKSVGNRLFQAEMAKEGMYLAFEYMDFDLKKLMDHRTLTRNETTLFLKLILKGLDHCHSRGVLHRDLRPANLLIDKDISMLKLADFGLARCFTIPTRPYSPDVMSLHYKTPEMLGALEPCDYHTSERGQEFRMEANRLMFRGNSEVSQANLIFSGCSLCQTRELPSLRII